MTPAVELSYLKPEEQALLLETIDSEQAISVRYIVVFQRFNQMLRGIKRADFIVNAVGTHSGDRAFRHPHIPRNRLDGLFIRICAEHIRSDFRPCHNTEQSCGSFVILVKPVNRPVLRVETRRTDRLKQHLHGNRTVCGIAIGVQHCQCPARRAAGDCHPVKLVAHFFRFCDHRRNSTASTSTVTACKAVSLLKDVCGYGMGVSEYVKKIEAQYHEQHRKPFLVQQA